MILESIVQYHGIDWVASSLAAMMNYFLGNKNRIGFYFGIAANLTWLAFAILAASPPIFLFNFVFLTLNLRSIRKWKPHLTTTYREESLHDKFI